MAEIIHVSLFFRVTDSQTLRRQERQSNRSTQRSQRRIAEKLDWNALRRRQYISAFSTPRPLPAPVPPFFIHHQFHFGCGVSRPGLSASSAVLQQGKRSGGRWFR